MTNLAKQQWIAVCKRLETDYREKFVASGVSSFNCWANPTTVAADLDFGDGVGRTRTVGASWGGRYGWLRRVRQTRPLAEAEEDVGKQLDELLANPPWHK